MTHNLRNADLVIFGRYWVEPLSVSWTFINCIEKGISVGAASTEFLSLTKLLKVQDPKSDPPFWPLSRIGLSAWCWSVTNHPCSFLRIFSLPSANPKLCKNSNSIFSCSSVAWLFKCLFSAFLKNPNHPFKAHGSTQQASHVSHTEGSSSPS